MQMRRSGSVLRGITGAVQAQVAARTNSAIKSLNSGVGSLSGRTSDGNTSAIDSISKKDKYGTTLLTYPTKVDSDPQQGHYIIFDIKKFTPGKAKSPKVKKAFNEVMRQVVEENPLLDEKSQKQLANNQIIAASKIEDSMPAAPPQRKGRGGSIQAEKATVRTGAVISLYMPPSVQVNYGINFADKEIGTMAMLGKDAMEAFKGANTEAKFRGAAEALTGSGAKEGVTNLVNGLLDGIASGSKALQQISSGKVITPRMELMFEGVGRRSFSYTFVFIPKSAFEAKIIKDVIYTFKENMMPEYSNTETRREMKIPNVFDITYMYQGAPNEFLNRISTCFLKNMTVQYGADRYTAYDPIPGMKGAPPQKSQITLEFSEMETLNKDMIKEGF